eukprot:TRINITY_DN3153_c0_g1_i12.p2 TRINITY_DN3153_c0_g1~~TRINITY_DN3153_c0_g1_i12.p2  ORF type:complete len:278 (-),score=27.54 TRINITY_DN3153_c0_g1_i12:27-860(-)
MTGEVLESHNFHKDIWCSSWSHTGQLLALGGRLGHIEICEGMLHRSLHKLSTTESDLFTISVAFSPNGERLASGGDDRIIRIWDPRDGVLLSKIPARKWIVSLVWHPHEPLLGVGLDASGECAILSLEAQSLLERRKLFSSWTRFCAFIRDGTQALFVNDDGNAEITDAKTLVCVRRLPLLRSLDGPSCFFGAGERLVLVAGDRLRACQLLDTETGSVRDLEFTGTAAGRVPLAPWSRLGALRELCVARLAFVRMSVALDRLPTHVADEVAGLRARS